jgi:hypothetical protein
MSEGVGFVNTALLEEEHDQPLTHPGTTGVLDGRRDEGTLARSRVAEEGGQGRPQAARRGSLEGPVTCCRTIGHEARQGFMDAPFRCPPAGRVRSSSPVPHGW